ASISDRKDGPGVILSTGSGRQQRRVQFRTREDANAAVALELKLRRQLDWTVTIDEALERYEEYIRLKRRPGTVRRYLRELKTWREFMRVTFLGVKRIRDVQTEHIEAFQAARIRGRVHEPDDERLMAREQQLRAELLSGVHSATPADNARFGLLGHRKLQPN